jgi:predicted AAA+ superfamily ATPase
MHNHIRVTYIERIKPYIGNNLIKVIVGQRRVGKSYFIKQIIELILKNSPETQVIYINKEDYAFDKIKTYSDLITYVEENAKQSKIALFVDEIQEINEFERALRHFQNKDYFDQYCTGSNSTILSGNLATLLSGRCIEFEVFSLSYREFLQFHKFDNTNESFEKYFTYGGMPNLIHLPLNTEIVFNYLKNVYNTIIVHDVIERHAIRNVVFLRNLTQFIADNTGSLVSSKKISDFLKSQKVNISPTLVSEYLTYLSETFFIFKVQRSDLQGKKIFEIGEKYYFNDIGLRNSLVGYKVADINKLLENIVFMHLKIAGYEVTVGQDRNKEIDFVAQKNNERIYIQVCYKLNNESTISREFGNLLKISNNYPKYVVSMDASSQTSMEGIKHEHIRDFCMRIN